MKSTIFSLGCALAAGLLATGCGGGGSDTPTVTGSPEGVYEGTSSTGKYFNTIVLENNTYFTIYGTMASSVFGVQGLINGTGTASNGNFNSTDLKDFSNSGAVASGSLTASYVPGTSFSGSTTSGGTTVTFNGTKPSGTSYNYNTAANPTNIVGAWLVTTGSGATANLNVASNGAYTGTTSAGCSISGNITPRASGKNVFDATMVTGAAPCSPANTNYTGNAVEYLLSNGKRQLIVAGTNATRTTAVLAFGSR